MSASTSIKRPCSQMESPLRKLEQFWMPKLWHGMSLSAWLRMLRQHGFRVSPSRWPLAAMVTLFAGSNSLSGLLQRVLYGRKVANTELVAPPLFVLGHWRSGTSLLHELLALDPRHTSPNTYECFSPCHFLVSGWLANFLGFALPRRRLPDRMSQSWDSPQEDEAALCNLGEPTVYWRLAFPNDPFAAADYLEMESVSTAESRRWEKTFCGFLQSITLLRPQRIVLKSPTHTFRIPKLRRLFPNSRFVYIVRNPQVVIPSTMHLWRVMRDSQGLQPAKHATLQEEVLDTFQHMDETVERYRSELPPHQFAVVKYEELVADPIQQLQRIYSQLELGDFDSTRNQVEAYLDSRRDYRTNQYEVEDGLRELIRERCGEFSQRFGYE